jgi:hypothetical protein
MHQLLQPVLGLRLYFADVEMAAVILARVFCLCMPVFCEYLKIIFPLFVRKAKKMQPLSKYFQTFFLVKI